MWRVCRAQDRNVAIRIQNGSAFKVTRSGYRPNKPPLRILLDKLISPYATCVLSETRGVQQALYGRQYALDKNPRGCTCVNLSMWPLFARLSLPCRRLRRLTIAHRT